MACGLVAHRDSLEGGREGEVMVLKFQTCFVVSLRVRSKRQEPWGLFLWARLTLSLRLSPLEPEGKREDMYMSTKV